MTNDKRFEEVKVEYLLEVKDHRRLGNWYQPMNSESEEGTHHQTLGLTCWIRSLLCGRSEWASKLTTTDCNRERLYDPEERWHLVERAWCR